MRRRNRFRSERYRLDIKNINVDEKVDYELPTELLKERLKKLANSHFYELAVKVSI